MDLLKGCGSDWSAPGKGVLSAFQRLVCHRNPKIGKSKNRCKLNHDLWTLTSRNLLPGQSLLKPPFPLSPHVKDGGQYGVINVFLVEFHHFWDPILGLRTQIFLWCQTLANIVKNYQSFKTSKRRGSALKERPSRTIIKAIEIRRAFGPWAC